MLFLNLAGLPVFAANAARIYSTPGTELKTASPASVSSVRRSRGYVTTPDELAAVARKAAQGLEPYRDAVIATEHFANTGSATVERSKPDPDYWPYGTINGPQSCSGAMTPEFVAYGSPLVEAKAFAYGLFLSTDESLANQYAADIRKHLLELASTDVYNGDSYSGSNQCILNLAWYVPGWIIAADLIENYPGWSENDKRTFQRWLATIVYKKVDWASDKRSNNWGAAGSAASGMIADYLTGSTIEAVDRDGKKIDPSDAYQKAKGRQLDRINGNSYMDNYNCHEPGVGIRPDGGIPEELARGSTGCSGLWIASLDKSWTYTQTYLQGVVLQAEMLRRRGDPSLYNNISPNGGGSILKAALFLLNNPNNPSKSVPWNVKNDSTTLEMLYCYYRNPYMAEELGIGTGDRHITGRGGQMLHFGTLTHAFAQAERPEPPPTVPPPED